MEEKQTTRRGFLQAMGAVAVFGDDDDDEESLWDRIFGDEPDSGEYTVKFGTKEEFQDTEAGEKTAFRVIPDGPVYRAVEDEDSLIAGEYNWKEIPSTGSNPAFDDVDAGSVSTEEANTRRDPTKFDPDVGAGIEQATADWPEYQQGAGGRLELPIGEHETSQGAELKDGVVVDGSGIRASTIKASGMSAGDSLLHYYTHDDTTDKDKYFPEIQHLRLDGNSEDVIGFKAGEDTNSAPGSMPNDLHFQHVIVRNTGLEGILCEQTAGWGYRFTNILVEGCGAPASNGDRQGTVRCDRAQFYMDKAFIAYNTAKYGIHSTADYNSFSNVWIYENDKNGGLFSNSKHNLIGVHTTGNGQNHGSFTTNLRIGTGADHTHIIGSYIDGQDAGGTITADGGLRVESNDVLVSNVTAINHNNWDMRIDGADVELWGCRLGSAGIIDNGTRTRWNGVIGGGPLGGVDLSVTTGQKEGEIALSSGATANTGDNAYSYWTWDATNSVWNDGNGNTV